MEALPHWPPSAIAAEIPEQLGLYSLRNVRYACASGHCPACRGEAGQHFDIQWCELHP